ncbi:lateral signaling target protein 2 [Tanacetum coccineum]
MVSLRLSIFVHAILFMLLHSLAYSLQDTKKMMVMTRDKIQEGNLLSEQKKEIFNAIPANTELVAKAKIIEGRKMMKIMSEGHINEEKTVSRKQSSCSSFSTSNARNGVHKMTKKSKKIGQQDHQVKAKMSSTIMFNNADYYVPRSHPPRHN